MIQDPGTDEKIEYRDPTVVLRAALEGIIQDLDSEFQVLTKARIKWMQRALTTHIIDLTRKFIRGQVEHGDNIEKVDLKHEIMNEVNDLFWYLTAHSNPLKKKQHGKSNNL